MDFEGFVGAELAGLRRFAGVLIGDRDIAHEVLVDTLIMVSRRWQQIADMQYPLAYVRRSLVTTFLADRRKAARRKTSPTVDDEVLDRVDQGSFRRVDDRYLLDKLLRELPRQQRTAVVLRFYLDYDDAAIAAVMDTSTSSVRSTITRALASLRVTPDIIELQEHM